MKRIPEHNSRKETQNKSASDLKGFTELGMKREALKLTRRKLKQMNITAKDFSEALNAILIQADKCILTKEVLALNVNSKKMLHGTSMKLKIGFKRK